MKKKFFLLCAFLILVTVGCNDSGEPEPGEPDLIEQTTPMFDSLKGEWSWFQTYGGIGGNTTTNGFTSIIKILSQNKDTSINYEVIVEDILFSKGSFQLVDTWGSSTGTNIVLPHLPVDTKVWWMRIYPPYDPNKEVLGVWDGIIDGVFYFYQKLE